MNSSTMSFNFHHIVALFISLIMSSSSCVISQNDEDLTKGASFIFGDSLVDAGNNNYLPTLSRANIAPNDIDFKASGGSPTGRYTNGRTIGDIIGEELGQYIMLGVNYASGGGGIMNATGRIFGLNHSYPSKELKKKNKEKLSG